MRTEVSVRKAIKELANRYGMEIIEETGFTSPIYHLLEPTEMAVYMLARWEPRARMH